MPKKIIKATHRRTLEDRLNDALASKPTQKYLALRGLTAEQLRNTKKANVGLQMYTPLKRTAIIRNPSPSILITGSIGDAIAVETLFTSELRQSLRIIYYATRQYKVIQSLFAAVPSYRTLSHIPLWDDFSSRGAFFTKQEVLSKLIQSGRAVPNRWPTVQDHSIATIFPMFNNGTVRYTGSLFLDEKMGEIRQFDLPSEYYVVCPYSSNDKRDGTRDFEDDDWERLLSHLTRTGRTGVIVHSGGEAMPSHPHLINLANKTSIGEAVEVLKAASGYFGIDSALSVLAGKLFRPPNLVIRSRSPHLYNWKHLYYSPHTRFAFVREKLEIDG